MINRVVLLGRLTKDPELRETQNGISTCNFTVACDRRTGKDQEKKADFISCVAWRQDADFLGRYGHKGDVIGVDGRIQTRTYEKDGTTVYVTEVVAESVKLPVGKKETATTNDYLQYEPKKSEPIGDQIQFDYGTRNRTDTIKLGEMEAQDLSGDDLPF